MDHEQLVYKFPKIEVHMVICTRNEQIFAKLHRDIRSMQELHERCSCIPGCRYQF